MNAPLGAAPERIWLAVEAVDIRLGRASCKTPRCELLRRSIRSPGAIFVASEACPAERLT
jgi:hypothetical protein